jgi:hypothetical protein
VGRGDAAAEFLTVDASDVVYLGTIMDEKIKAAFNARANDISHPMAQAGAARIRARASDIYYDMGEAMEAEIAIEIFRAMLEARGP